MECLEALDVVVSIVTGGVSENAFLSGVDLERALQYKIHRIANEHIPAIWKKIREGL